MRTGAPRMRRKKASRRRPRDFDSGRRRRRISDRQLERRGACAARSLPARRPRRKLWRCASRKHLSDAPVVQAAAYEHPAAGARPSAIPSTGAVRARTHGSAAAARSGAAATAPHVADEARPGIADISPAPPAPRAPTAGRAELGRSPTERAIAAKTASCYRAPPRQPSGIYARRRTDRQHQAAPASDARSGAHVAGGGSRIAQHRLRERARSAPARRSRAPSIPTAPKCKISNPRPFRCS